MRFFLCIVYINFQFCHILVSFSKANHRVIRKLSSPLFHLRFKKNYHTSLFPCYLLDWSQHLYVKQRHFQLPIFTIYLPSPNLSQLSSFRPFIFLCEKDNVYLRPKPGWPAQCLIPMCHFSPIGPLGYGSGHGPPPYFTPRAIFYIICVHLPPKGRRMRLGKILVIYYTL
jgi:hypothetical protein